MTATTFFAIVIPAWVAIGVITALLMARRGHAAFPWLILGAIFGPLVIPLVLDARKRAHDDVVVIEAGEPGRGAVDVLIGIDGSPQSMGAIEAVRSLIGRRVGRLTLATVLDYDAVGSVEGEIEERAAVDALESLRERVAKHAQVIILHGKPAEALTKWALEDGYDLLAVGSRGRGMSRRLLGSVATALAADAAIPVLVVDASRRAAA